MADLVVPQLGESITEAVVSTWLKQVGDQVAADEPVAELETDKITVQLPSPVAGVLASQAAQVGATVKPGDVIGAVEAAAQSTAAPKAAEAPAAQASGAQAGEASGAQAGQASSSSRGATASQASGAQAGQAASASGGRASSSSRQAAGSSASQAASASGGQASSSSRQAAGSSAQASSGQRGEASGASAGQASPSSRQAAGSSAQASSGQRGQASSTSGGQAPGGSSSKGDGASAQEAGGNGESLDKAALLKLTPSQRVQAREVGTIPQKQGAPAVAAQGAHGPSADERLAQVDPRDEVVAMSPLRKRVAERLVQAQHESASLTTFNEVDMTEVMALRAKHKDSFEKAHGVKLGFMSFFVKACIAACKAFPGLNAEVVGGHIVYKKHYDFGIAVSTPKGLVVPVLRDCDALSFAGIEKGILALAEKARTGKLALADLTGGTFSITNGGIYGSMMSTPLLNYPQTGILGMHNIVKRAVVISDDIKVRPMMYVALSYDHRVVDGREAVSFLVAVKDRLESPDRMMLEV